VLGGKWVERVCVGEITTLKVKGDKNTFFLTHCFCYWQDRAKPSNSNFCTSKKK
jgi:hypothetical protein